MSFEIGEPVLSRGLLGEVEDTSSEASLALIGRSRENQGRRIRALLDLDEIVCAKPPTLKWTIGLKGWKARRWKVLHDTFRFSLSLAHGNLTSAGWDRLALEPYQFEPLQRIEHLPFLSLLLADDAGLGKTAEAGLILFRLMKKQRANRVLLDEARIMTILRVSRQHSQDNKGLLS